MKKIILASLIISFLPQVLFARPSSQRPKDLWEAVNNGWGEPHSQLFEHFDPNKNYIIWSIIAPKDPIDLRKPDFFRRFVSKNVKQNLSISHNLVAWKCVLPDGQHYMGATGHSGEVSSQSEKLVKAGYGLTTFLAKYTDGWLSDGFDTGDIITRRGQSEEVYSIAVEVSSKDCANMLGFLKKFIFHPKKPVRNFGLAVNPEKFEGAGCITFAAALMKKAGIFTEVFKNANRKLFASHYRFGGNDLPLPENTIVPRISWREGEPKKVSVMEFLNANWNAGLKGVKLDLLDPELLVWGVKSLSERMSRSPRKVLVMPEPGCGDRGDICLPKYVSVNDNYDSQAQKVSRAARAWKKKMVSKGLRMSEVKIAGKPFLIFKSR